MSKQHLLTHSKKTKEDNLLNLIGKTFGSWRVIGDKIEKNRTILCRCACGTEKLVKYQSLKLGTSRSCGCQKNIQRNATMKMRHGVKHPGETLASRAGARLRGIEIQQQWLSENIGKTFGELTILGPMVGQRVLCRCSCGNELFVRKYKLIYREIIGCKKCAPKRLKETSRRLYGVDNPAQTAASIEKRRRKGKETYQKIRQTMLSRYGADNPLAVPEFMEKFQQTVSQHGWRSSGEQELVDFIKSLGFKVEKSYCGGSTPCEIDIEVKNEKGDAVLYIEYNGDYWHSEKGGRDRNYHLAKSELCLKTKGRHLLHIFESEWNQKRRAVENYIRAQLTVGRPIRASKCDILVIDHKTANEFLKDRHLQGGPVSSILCLGLYHKGELVSVATFSNPHRQNMEKIPMLSRYAVEDDVRIHGGLSRLSKYAYSKIGPFFTYVHKRLSTGESYEKAGYTLIKEIGPDYWYWDSRNHRVVSKQSRKKAAVGTPEGMTEREHAWREGLFRVWDCGKLKFLYDPDNNYCKNT